MRRLFSQIAISTKPKFLIIPTAPYQLHDQYQNTEEIAEIAEVFNNYPSVYGREEKTRNENKIKQKKNRLPEKMTPNVSMTTAMTTSVPPSPKESYGQRVRVFSKPLKSISLLNSVKMSQA